MGDQPLKRIAIWTEHSKLNFSATMEFGREATKAGMLINGGAAVALLAFVGQTAARIEPASILPIAKIIGLFAFGVLFAALASGLSYLAQLQYSYALQRSFGLLPYTSTSFRSRGRVCHGMAVAAMFLSYAMFVTGAMQAASAVGEAKWIPTAITDRSPGEKSANPPTKSLGSENK
jgi:hypothetical protein